MRISLIIFAVMCAVFGATPAEAAPAYSATRLGTLGGTGATGGAINGAGEVTGFSFLSGNAVKHPFLYSGGVMRDLGTFGGPTGYAYAINDSGQVVGGAWTANNVILA